MAFPALLIMAGVSAASSIMKGTANRRAAKAQNKEIAKANATNVLEAQQAVLGVEVQRAKVRQQTAKDLSLADRMAGEARGTVEMSAAAAGVKGASVDAAVADIAREAGELAFEIDQRHLAQEYNLNQQIVQILKSTQFGLVKSLDVPSTRDIVMGGLVSGAMSAASSYAGSYFQFGSSGSTALQSAGTYGNTGIKVNTAGFRAGVGPGR